MALTSAPLIEKFASLHCSVPSQLVLSLALVDLRHLSFLSFRSLSSLFGPFTDSHASKTKGETLTRRHTQWPVCVCVVQVKSFSFCLCCVHSVLSPTTLPTETETLFGSLRSMQISLDRFFFSARTVALCCVWGQCSVLLLHLGYHLGLCHTGCTRHSVSRHSSNRSSMCQDCTS